MPRYTLLALDIDGTIKSSEQSIPHELRATIAKVNRTGARVTLATGRMLGSTLPVAAELGLSAPIICYQGAMIAYPTTGRVLWHRPLTPSMAQTTLEAMASWGLPINMYLNDRLYVAEMTEWVKSYVRSQGIQVEVIHTWGEVIRGGPTKIAAVGDEARIEEMRQQLQMTFDSRLLITKSFPFLCEVGHPETGKGKALARVAASLGVAREQTVAVGDSSNDEDMLRWAGLGVAVQGAPKEVIAAADLVVPPLEEKGVARFLETLLEDGQLGS